VDASREIPLLKDEGGKPAEKTHSGAALCLFKGRFVTSQLEKINVEVKGKTSRSRFADPGISQDVHIFSASLVRPTVRGESLNSAIS